MKGFDLEFPLQPERMSNLNNEPKNPDQNPESHEDLPESVPSSPVSREETGENETAIPEKVDSDSTDSVTTSSETSLGKLDSWMDENQGINDPTSSDVTEDSQQTPKKSKKILATAGMVVVVLVGFLVGTYINFAITDHKMNHSQEQVYAEAGSEIDDWTDRFLDLNSDSVIKFRGKSYTDDSSKDYTLFELKKRLAKIKRADKNGNNFDLRGTTITIYKDKSYTILDKNNKKVLSTKKKQASDSPSASPKTSNSPSASPSE